MIKDAGAGSSDSAQLAVELAQAHDALASLQEERTHLLRQLLEQQRAQGDASAMRSAGGVGWGGGGDGVGLLAEGLAGLDIAKGHDAGGPPGSSDARGRDSGSSGRGSNPFADSAAAGSAPAFEDGMGAGSAAEQTLASEAALVFQHEEPFWRVQILKRIFLRIFFFSLTFQKCSPVVTLKSKSTGTLTFLRISKGGDASASQTHPTTRSPQMQPTTAFEASPQKRQIEAKVVDSTAASDDESTALSQGAPAWSSSGDSAHGKARASVAGTLALASPPAATLALASPYAPGTQACTSTPMSNPFDNPFDVPFEGPKRPINEQTRPINEQTRPADLVNDDETARGGALETDAAGEIKVVASVGLAGAGGAWTPLGSSAGVDDVSGAVVQRGDDDDDCVSEIEREMSQEGPEDEEAVVQDAADKDREGPRLSQDWEGKVLSGAMHAATAGKCEDVEEVVAAAAAKKEKAAAAADNAKEEEADAAAKAVEAAAAGAEAKKKKKEEEEDAAAAAKKEEEEAAAKMRKEEAAAVTAKAQEAAVSVALAEDKDGTHAAVAKGEGEEEAAKKQKVQRSPPKPNPFGVKLKSAAKKDREEGVRGELRAGSDEGVGLPAAGIGVGRGEGSEEGVGREGSVVSNAFGVKLRGNGKEVGAGQQGRGGGGAGKSESDNSEVNPFGVKLKKVSKRPDESAVSHGFWGLKDGAGRELKDGDRSSDRPSSHLSRTSGDMSRGMGETLVAENKDEESEGQEEVAAVGARGASTEDKKHVAMAGEDGDGDGDGGVEGGEPLTLDGNGEPLMGLLGTGQALVTGQTQGGELGLGPAQITGEAGQHHDPPQDCDVQCPLPSNPSDNAPSPDGGEMGLGQAQGGELGLGQAQNDSAPSPNGNMLDLLGVGDEKTPFQHVAETTVASPRHAPHAPAAVGGSVELLQLFGEASSTRAAANPAQAVCKVAPEAPQGGPHTEAVGGGGGGGGSGSP